MGFSCTYYSAIKGRISKIWNDFYWDWFYNADYETKIIKGLWIVIFLLSYLCYSNKVHKACKQLAAIYWNFHMNLEAATTKAGEQIVTRKYNQRTNDWDVKIITVKKKFEYIPVMMVKIFNMRKKKILILLQGRCLWMKATLLCWLPPSLTNRHPLQRNFLWHVRADFNLVLKIIQPSILDDIF